VRTLDDLRKDRDRILIIHYASTSIFTQPVVITQISVRDYSSGQTQSFGHDSFDSEKGILRAFADFMAKKPGYLVVGWNFHGKTYGIQMMEERWKANHFETPFPVEPDQVVDIDDVLASKYGWAYAVGPNRLKRLAEANRIVLLNFVEGGMEPDLFAQEKYRELLLSTERKVAVVADLLTAAFDGTFRVLPNIPQPTPATGSVLRVVLTLAAVSQMYVFVGIVLISMVSGPVDFTWPVKTALLSTIIILDGFAIGDFRRDWRGRAANPAQLGISTYRLIGEIGTSLALLALVYGFLVQTLAGGNLAPLSLEVKFVVIMGLAIIVGFSLLALSDIRPIMRRRKNPPSVEGAGP
jgi:hypothetical protein